MTEININHINQGILGIQVKDIDGDLGVLVSFSSKDFNPDDKLVILYPDRTVNRLRVIERKKVSILSQAFYYLSQEQLTFMMDEVRDLQHKLDKLEEKYGDLRNQYTLLQATLLNSANDDIKN